MATKKTSKKPTKIRKVSVRKGKKIPPAKSKKQEKRIELSSKEFKINLAKLQQDVKRAYDGVKKVLPEAIKEIKVTKFGNAGHIIVPKEYVGKKATVLVKK